jgi:hypothetical protein
MILGVTKNLELQMLKNKCVRGYPKWPTIQICLLENLGLNNIRLVLGLKEF